MAIIKTGDLIGISLDWAVAKAGGGAKVPANFRIGHGDYGMFQYSTDWAQGGPIIEREAITLTINDYMILDWESRHIEHPYTPMRGPTPLIAAMRCYVASKLGDEVEVPEL